MKRKQPDRRTPEQEARVRQRYPEAMAIFERERANPRAVLTVQLTRAQVTHLWRLVGLAVPVGRGDRQRLDRLKLLFEPHLTPGTTGGNS